MKIIIIGGFLGSGKTSVLLQLAKHIAGNEPTNTNKIVIIENEIGEVGVDDKLLVSSGYEVKTLFSGCVCCTLSSAIDFNLRRIEEELSPEYVILEATGVAYPGSIKSNIERNLGYDCTICCVVDAKRWERLALCMEQLISMQLESADTILINKADKVNKLTLDTVEESIKKYNSSGLFYRVSASEKISNEVFKDIIKGGEIK